MFTAHVSQLVNVLQIHPLPLRAYNPSFFYEIGEPLSLFLFINRPGPAI